MPYAKIENRKNKANSCMQWLGSRTAGPVEETGMWRVRCEDIREMRRARSGNLRGNGAGKAGAHLMLILAPPI